MGILRPHGWTFPSFACSRAPSAPGAVGAAAPPQHKTASPRPNAWFGEAPPLWAGGALRRRDGSPWLPGPERKRAPRPEAATSAAGARGRCLRTPPTPMQSRRSGRPEAGPSAMVLRRRPAPLPPSPPVRPHRKGEDAALRPCLAGPAFFCSRASVSGRRYAFCIPSPPLFLWQLLRPLAALCDFRVY